MLALKPSGVDLVLDAGAVAPYVAPPITPTAPPAYIPPTNPIIAPNPLPAAPPPYQFRGVGGTPFGSNPAIYHPTIFTPMILPRVNDVSGYGRIAPPTKPPPPGVVVTPGLPGSKQVMPVPTGQQPTQPPIGKAVESVDGPLHGNVGGFDLSRVPFWGWLVGAAFIGSRLLR